VLAAIGQPMAKADHHRTTKSFRQPILKNVNARLRQNGDRDWKHKSCFAFHASLGAFALNYWATIKIASPISGLDHVDRAAVPSVFDGESYDTAEPMNRSQSST
jgi:hypothetical protein